MSYSKLKPGEIAPHKKVGNLRCLVCQNPLRKAQTKWCSIECNRKGNRPPTGRPEGRPTKMTPETISKLEEAFAIGASDSEACFYADISNQVLYNYQTSHPEFVERKERLKERPVLLARQAVMKGLENNDSALGMKYLERRKPKEFATRQELTGADGKDLPSPIVSLEGLRTNDTSD